MQNKQNKVEGLTSAQEALVERYYDNECGFVGRMRAESLLRSSEAARGYLEGLEAIKDSVLDYESVFPGPSEDMWPVILRRIALQERLDLISLEKPGFFGKLYESFFWGAGARLSWGAVGGVVAALLLLLIVEMPVDSRQSSSAHITSNQAAQPIQLASSALQQAAPRTSYIDSRSLSPSFGKLRSVGRVKVTRRPSENSIIFWVNKRPTEVPVAPDKNKAGVFYLDPSMAVDPLLQGD